MTGIPRKLVGLKFIDRRVSSLGDRTVATSSLVRTSTTHHKIGDLNYVFAFTALLICPSETRDPIHHHSQR
jgi:hypothetical protein